jgi:hypothetical protein
MFDLKHNVRPVIAALCAITYVATLQQFSPLVALLMHGSHEVQVVEHGGHTDVVFHHEHDDDDHDDDLPASDHDQLDDHHHGDHVVQVAAQDVAAVFSGELPRLASAIILLTHLSTLGVYFPRIEIMMLAKARPPPLIGGSVLNCLRTTMLVI